MSDRSPEGGAVKVSLAFACVYLQDGCSFWIRSQPGSWVTSMMRKLEIWVSRSLSLSGIATIILGAMHVGAIVMAVFLILVQFKSREDLPRTFPPLLRVKLGVLGLSWDFWAKSVSELQLEVEQIQLTRTRMKDTKKHEQDPSGRSTDSQLQEALCANSQSQNSQDPRQT